MRTILEKFLNKEEEGVRVYHRVWGAYKLSESLKVSNVKITVSTNHSILYSISAARERGLPVPPGNMCIRVCTQTKLPSEFGFSLKRNFFVFFFFVNKNIWLKNYTNCENNEYVMNNKSILVTFISCLHLYNKLYSHLDTQKFWIRIFFHSLYQRVKVKKRILS